MIHSLGLFAEEEWPLIMLIDDEKVSYQDYLRELQTPALNVNQNNRQIEDWDCECESEFMADMPTNESFTIEDEMEEREYDNAENFLQEMGLLYKIDDEEQFDLNSKSDHSQIFENQSIENASVRCFSGSSIKEFKIFEDPFEYEFNPADTLQEQLKKDPLPSMFTDTNEEEAWWNLDQIEIDGIEAYMDVTDNLELSCLSSWQKMASNQTPKIEIQIEEIKQNSKPKKKKLTEFGYLLQRKGFRLLRKYYKEKFEDFASKFGYKKKVKKITPTEISEMIMKFIELEFSAVLSALTLSELAELQDCLKKVILSDRSNKNEPMIAGTDFTIVKNLFWKYTTKNMKLFLESPANSFLYAHFYLINGRYECFKQTDVDQINLNAQMKKTLLEAFGNLFDSVRLIYEKLYEANSENL